MEINNEIERVEGILNHLRGICKLTENTKDSVISVLPHYKEKVKLYEWVLGKLKEMNGGQ